MTRGRDLLDRQIPLWGLIAFAFAVIVQAVTAQAKIAEHDRELTDLKDVVPAIRALQAEVSGLREDVRDLRNDKD